MKHLAGMGTEYVVSKNLQEMLECTGKQAGLIFRTYGPNLACAFKISNSPG
jgi:hypothetical protein